MALSSPNPETLKIAIASSGLGHIRRGVETWADDLGRALRRRGLDATTFQGGRPVDESGAARDVSPNVVVPCLKRFGPGAQLIARIFNPLRGWELGLGNGYLVEQTTFALNLWRRIGRSHDILHVQDSQVALIFEMLGRRGLSRPRVILGHGTEEDPAFLQRLSYLQHLAPTYLGEWERHRPKGQLSFAVPNFVDTSRFRPAADAAERLALRTAAGVPGDALLFLSVGALKRHHKRVDYLMREFSSWRRAQAPEVARRAKLLVLGAREHDTPELMRLRDELDAEAITLIENAPRERVMALLQAADVFALGSLHEMMPIAVLEAIACGLPVACNADPTLEWMVGDAGQPQDISQPGGLAAQFSLLSDPAARARFSVAARRRAETLFSEQAVVDQILEMYGRVAARS